MMSPLEFQMLRMMAQRRGSSQPINIKIDLSGLQDLWGRKKIQDEGEHDPTPISVNLPRISPG
jgi:hypothetical protein